MQTKTTKTTKRDGEYRVRLYLDNVAQPAADYFTDDLQDAKRTAEHMVRYTAQGEPVMTFVSADLARTFDVLSDGLVPYDVIERDL